MSAVRDQITKYQIWHLILSTFGGNLEKRSEKQQCGYKEHADISKVTQLSYLFGLSDLNLRSERQPQIRLFRLPLTIEKKIGYFLFKL